MRRILIGLPGRQVIGALCVMKCARAQDLFSNYLESAMDGPLCMAFEQHLAECPRCKAAYDRFHAAVMMLEEMPEAEPPADFHAAVMARVQRARLTTPAPVKWWRIDWQHVFTVRVPARAAAMGLAVLLVMVMAVQLTPLQSVVGNLIGISHKSSREPISVGGDLANRWTPSGVPVVDDRGLSFDVRPGARGTYDLRIGTESESPLAFKIRAGNKSFAGVVADSQDSVVRLAVPQGSDPLIAEVSWRHGNRANTELVFLPAEFVRSSGGKRLSITMQNTSVREVLSRVSREYGVVLLASGDLEKKLTCAVAMDRNPREALYDCLQEARMTSRALADSVYVVKPLR